MSESSDTFGEASMVSSLMSMGNERMNGTKTTNAKRWKIKKKEKEKKKKEKSNTETSDC